MPTASGANSVASALGTASRSRPAAAMGRYHEGRPTTFTRGTFYLPGSRKFLFGSNTGSEGSLTNTRAAFAKPKEKRRMDGSKT